MAHASPGYRERLQDGADIVRAQAFDTEIFQGRFARINVVEGEILLADSKILPHFDAIHGVYVAEGEGVPCRDLPERSAFPDAEHAHREERDKKENAP